MKILVNDGNGKVEITPVSYSYDGLKHNYIDATEHERKNKERRNYDCICKLEDLKKIVEHIYNVDDGIVTIEDDGVSFIAYIKSPINYANGNVGFVSEWFRVKE